MELNALPLRIAGLGAVSPAGWGCEALMEAVRAGVPLVHEETTRVPGALVQRWRRVPRPAAVASFAREPRLRRTSPITGFAVAAALEALGPEREARVKAGALRLGVVVVMLNGCVGFSRRFYGEVLENPSTASPLIFPETVFNAPSSHLASLLGAGGVNYTLVGDTAQFLTAFDLAALWLENGEVDGVLAVAAEEADWLSGEAAALFDKGVIVAEGAGAVYLETSRTSQVILQRPVAIGLQRSRRQAAAEMRGIWRRQFGADEHQQLLCDGLVGARRVDAAEVRAFELGRRPAITRPGARRWTGRARGVAVYRRRLHAHRDRIRKCAGVGRRHQPASARPADDPAPRSWHLISRLPTNP